MMNELIGWMDVWMNECMDGWMDRCINELMGLMDRWIDMI
jgi:hypothetical protein